MALAARTSVAVAAPVGSAVGAAVAAAAADSHGDVAPGPPPRESAGTRPASHPVSSASAFAAWAKLKWCS